MDGDDFSFLLLGTNLTAHGVEIGSGPAVLALDRTLLREQPVGTSIWFRVVGAEGGSGIASVELRNHPPAALLDPPRTLPRGGHPWRRGADPEYSVTFTATALDEDGDPPVEYRWSFSPDDTGSGQPDSMTTTNPTATRRLLSRPDVERRVTANVAIFYKLLRKPAPGTA